MLHPLSDCPAHATGLRRVSRVDEHHGQSFRLGFVSDKILKLTKRPAMQPRSDSFPALDPSANMGQVFHTNFTRAGNDGFCNNGLAGFVVDVLDMPHLTPGDSLELPLGGSATVGLEATTIGKVDVAVMPQFPTTPDLAGTGGGEIIFSNVDPDCSSACNGRNVGNIDDEVEVPDAFPGDQLRFLGRSAGKQVSLMLSADESDLDSPVEAEQRQNIAVHRIGTLVKIDRCWTEFYCRNWFILANALIGLKRLIGVGNPVNGLTHHLTPKFRDLVTNRVINQMVKCHSVPASMLLDKGYNSIASLSKGVRKHTQRRRLLGGCDQLQRYGALAHIGILTYNPIVVNKGGGAFLSGLNAGVFSPGIE